MPFHLQVHPSYSLRAITLPSEQGRTWVSGQWGKDCVHIYRAPRLALDFSHKRSKGSGSVSRLAQLKSVMTREEERQGTWLLADGQILGFPSLPGCAVPSSRTLTLQ